MKTLYKFNFSCGRKGDLYGLFIEDSDEVQKLIESGKEICFGEVLGKHSNICGPVEVSDVTKITDDPVVIKIVEDYKLCVGYNPFNYLEE
jgi:hypothetical protein